MTTTTDDPTTAGSHADRLAELAELADTWRDAAARLTAARDRLDQAIHAARQERVSFGRISHAIGQESPNIHRRYKAWLQRQGNLDG